MKADPMLSIIERGHEVYSKVRRHGGFGDYPIGGTVVDILDVADPETGERLRSFHCIEFHGGRLQQTVITAEEADVQNAMPFSPHRCVRLARRIAAVLADKRGMSGMLSPEELELDRLQHELVAIAIGRRS